MRIFSELDLILGRYLMKQNINAVLKPAFTVWSVFEQIRVIFLRKDSLSLVFSRDVALA